MLITIKDIYKSYGQKSSQVHALKGVSFQVQEGQFIAIMGKSGCGKSTLLHILAGYIEPTKGDIFFDLINFTKLRESARNKFRKNSIAFVFQFFNLFEELTVLENIELPLKLKKQEIDPNEIKELLRLLQIEDKINQYPCDLSGGQQQRVAIARALAIKPKLILADEPTGNLDEETSREVLNLLMRVKQQFNISIIMATHDKDVASYADMVIQMSDGKII